MTILVDKEDGTCSECGGQLEITGADDVSLDADCTDCGNSIHVETDFFHNGGIKYCPEAMVEFGEEE